MVFGATREFVLELFQKIIRFGNSGLSLCVSILEQTIGFVNNEMQVSIGCVYRRGQKLLHLKGVTMIVALFNNNHRLIFSFTNVVLPFICVSFLVKREWEKTNAIYLIFVTDGVRGENFIFLYMTNVEKSEISFIMCTIYGILLFFCDLRCFAAKLVCCDLRDIVWRKF